MPDSGRRLEPILGEMSRLAREGGAQLDVDSRTRQ